MADAGRGWIEQLRQIVAAGKERGGVAVLPMPSTTTSSGQGSDRSAACVGCGGIRRCRRPHGRAARSVPPWPRSAADWRPPGVRWSAPRSGTQRSSTSVTITLSQAIGTAESAAKNFAGVVPPETASSAVARCGNRLAQVDRQRGSASAMASSGRPEKACRCRRRCSVAPRARSARHARSARPRPTAPRCRRYSPAASRLALSQACGSDRSTPMPPRPRRGA